MDAPCIGCTEVALLLKLWHLSNSQKNNHQAVGSLIWVVWNTTEAYDWHFVSVVYLGNYFPPVYLESEAHSPYLLPYTWKTAPFSHNIWPLTCLQAPQAQFWVQLYRPWGLETLSKLYSLSMAFIKDVKGRDAGSLKTAVCYQERQHLCLNCNED